MAGEGVQAPQATEPWRRTPCPIHSDPNAPGGPRCTPLASISGRGTCVAVATDIHLTASIPETLGWPPVLGLSVPIFPWFPKETLPSSVTLLSQAVTQGSASSLAGSPEELGTSVCQSPGSQCLQTEPHCRACLGFGGKPPPATTSHIPDPAPQDCG